MVKIDWHGHILPYPEEIPDFVSNHNIFDVRREKNEKIRYMYNNGIKMRPITEEWSFPNERRERMNKNDIAHTVVFPLSQLYLNTTKDKWLVMDVLDWQNQYNRDLQTAHPDTYTTGIVVQPRYTTEAVQQIENAVREWVSIVFLCTHYLNNWQRFAFGEEEEIANPIMEALNKHHMALQFHPYDMEHIVNLRNTFWNHHTIFMSSLSAHTFQIFTGKWYHRKYPYVRTAFAHGDKTWFWERWRIRQWQEWRPDLYTWCLSVDEIFEWTTNIFFDTLFHDEDQLAQVVKLLWPEQVFAWLDSPYPLGDFKKPYPPKNPTDSSYIPFRYLELAREKWLITQSQAKQIYGKTVFDRVWWDMRERVLWN